MNHQNCRQLGRQRPPLHCCVPTCRLIVSIALLSFSLTAPSLVQAAEPAKVPPLVLVIGGFDSDPTEAQVAGTARRGIGNSGMFQLGEDLKKEGCAADYFNWNGTRAREILQQDPPLFRGIASFVRDQHRTTPARPVMIVGNSWGGHTAWEVGQELSQEPKIPIRLLVLLDPSSTGRGAVPQHDQLPDNIQEAVVYHTRNAFVWQGWPTTDRVTTIDLGNPQQGFLTSPQRAYQSTWNWQAHVAAEWDEKIHRDICRRVLETGQPLNVSPSN